MMLKGRWWKVIWLTWMVVLPTVAVGVLVVCTQGTRCQMFGPEVRTRAFMEQLYNIAALYRINTGQWPAADSAEFARLVENAGPHTYQLVQFSPSQVNRRREPVDAWGHALRFEFSERGVRMDSAGKDHCFGTADDLTFVR